MGQKKKIIWVGLVLIGLLVSFFNTPVWAAPFLPLPQIQVGVNESAGTPQQTAASLQILFLLTILSLAPAVLIMMTSFTRIIVVLSFLRSALSTQQMPPNQVLIGLALFLTFFTMAPTWNQVNEKAWQPYLAGKIKQEVALEKALEPIRAFMFKQTREKDLALFVYLSEIKRPSNPEEVPTYVLIPSFIISELKTAFQIGFMIFIPFLVIDIIVASTLMAMGMMMLPPVMISLPMKIMLFILVDGWHLIVRSLVLSFN